MTDPTSKDQLGDRMKGLENVESARRLNVKLPVYVRIDGRGFSKFTKDMKRPFDVRMSECMVETTRYLVDKTHARIGLTQSDEISLVYMASDEKEESDIFFNGRIQKIASVLAGMTTIAFVMEVLKRSDFAHYAERMPHFDARVFQLPDTMEAANAFLWRERDAKKNSVSMACRAHFSHRAMDFKSATEMIAMLAEKGVDFDDYPQFFKRGTWLRRERFEREFTAEELARIPEKHRPLPGTLVERSEVRPLFIEDFGAVQNRVGVIFDGETPVV